jgi:UDP-GlcNAc:undecaprenyl-phosphate GlcNAc-1-phosphate transferase
MPYLVLTFLVSTTFTALLIRYQNWHIFWSGDALSKPQKLHTGSPPRIGGIAIFASLFFGSILVFLRAPQYSDIYFLVIASSLPIFLTGLLEDLIKKVGFRIRFVTSIIAASLFILLVKIQTIEIGIATIDIFLLYPWISFLFLCFAISGLCNAYNIIDGLNGLASMVGILSLIAILYVGIKVNDSMTIIFCIICIGAILGFFIWNFPKGLIFLGDGGAYLIGFWIAVTVILLVVRNPNVSPWFALLVNSYAVFETLFSIWRRSIHKTKKVMMPDGAHFHSLLYRRIMKWTYLNSNPEHHYLSNSKTSPYLWLLSSIGLIPAVFFWDSTALLMLSSIIFITLYIYLYQKIVLFKTPSWISKRSKK